MGEEAEPNPGQGGFAGPDAKRIRMLAAFCLGIVALTGAAPALVNSLPGANWDPVLLLTVLALSLLIVLDSIVLRHNHTMFDASIVVSLFALVALGPVPALLLEIPATIFVCVARRWGVNSFTANMASYAVGFVAAGAVLKLGGVALSNVTEPSAWLWLFAATFAFSVVNWTVLTLLIDCVRDGANFAHVARTEVKALIGFLPVMGLGVVTLVAYGSYGILALVGIVASTAAFQLLFPLLLRPKPVGQLTRREAIRLYAAALAKPLKLDKRQLATAMYASEHVDGMNTVCNGAAVRDAADGTEYLGIDCNDVFDDVVDLLLYYRENWDGHTPLHIVTGNLGGEWQRIESRVLRVAEFWADHTVGDGWTVRHGRVLELLDERAGTVFDPKVVAAAHWVVEHEQMGLTDNQPEVTTSELPAFGSLIKRSLRQAFTGPEAGDAGARR